MIADEWLRFAAGSLEVLLCAVERPDLDGVDLHGGLVGLGVSPGLVPAVVVVEPVLSVVISVGPWLAAIAVTEEAVCASDSDVHDQVELLVEWSIVTAAVPWVLTAEVTSLVEALTMHVDIEDNVVWVVDVGVESLVSPDQAVGVHVVSKGVTVLVGVSGHVEWVVFVVRSPVEGRAESVVVATAVVATGLHHVDLARSRPASVHIVFWHEPDGWPDPVAPWDLGSNLDLSVLEGEGVSSLQTGTHEWLLVNASFTSIMSAIRGAAFAVIGCAVEIVVSMLHFVITTDGFGSESWLQVQHTIFDKGVLAVVVVHLELAVATASHGDLVLPHMHVE
jgi:hypothetical protein